MWQYSFCTAQVEKIKFREGGSLMLTDALKNYMDSYIKFYHEAFGKYPQVDAEMSEDPVIMERSGYLFNSLEELETPVRKRTDPLIPLPEGFWQRYYGQQEVPLSCLEKEKIIRIQNEDIDCVLFAYMGNLKERILHGCNLVNTRKAV